MMVAQNNKYKKEKIMKNISSKKLALTVVIALAFIFVNCKDDESNPAAPPEQDSNLIGTWELLEAYVPSMNITVNAQDLGISVTASFLENSNFEFSTTDSSGTEIESGTWSTSNGSLTLKSDDGTDEVIPYTIDGNVGILKSTYEIQPGFEVPADFKFIKQ